MEIYTFKGKPAMEIGDNKSVNRRKGADGGHFEHLL